MFLYIFISILTHLTDIYMFVYTCAFMARFLGSDKDVEVGFFILKTFSNSQIFIQITYRVFLVYGNICGWLVLQIITVNLVTLVMTVTQDLKDLKETKA